MTDIFDQGDQLQKDIYILQNKSNKGKSNKQQKQFFLLTIWEFS